MTIATRNIHEDLHILSKTLDKRGAMAFARSAQGLIEYCFMTDSKIHFILPVKLDGEEWRIASTISGISLKAHTIIETLSDIPDCLNAGEFEAVCVVQFGNIYPYKAFNIQDFANALDDNSHAYGVLTADEGAPWYPGDILEEVM